MKEQDTLQTTRGRAEVLLSPGVFLRVGRDSSLRLVSGDILDSKVELLAGNVVLEAGQLEKDVAVTLILGDSRVSILKRGLYRLDANPGGLSVFDGKALVESSGQRVELGKGKRLSFGPELVAAKFDRKNGDVLDRWSGRRAEYLALVNNATARTLMDRSSGLRCNGWCWNAFYGIVTFVPVRGYYFSPYGYYFYSPPALYQSYSRATYSNSPTGGSGLSASGAGQPTGYAGNTARYDPPASVQVPSGMGSTRSDPPAVARPGGSAR
jgi:hypothetical protein